MTTIATDGHVLAGDTSVCQDESRTYIRTKVFRVKGWLIGYGGTLAECQLTIEAMKKSRLMPDKYLKTYTVPKDVTLLMVDPKGRIWEYEHGISIRVPGKYHAIGLGSDVALGAMYVGANPVQALRAAKYHNKGTAGNITKRTL